MTVTTRTSLLMWVLLPALTLSQDVPSCQTRPRSTQDHEISTYNGKRIDIESCDQRPVVLYPNGTWWLTSTVRNPLQFVFTPHHDFQFFEVLFSRGRRSRAYNSLRVNKSSVDAGPYSVSITFRNEPIISSSPSIVCDIFINPSGDSLGENGPESEGSFLSGIKEFTCSSEIAPEGQTLSNIIILVVGGSEWLFRPDPDWSKCPITPPNQDVNIHENARRNLDSDSTNRSPPRNREFSTTTDFWTTTDSPIFRPRQPKLPVEESWPKSTTTTYSWNPNVQPRLPNYEHYGRNRSSSPAPDDMDDYPVDHVHGDDQEHTTSNATEESVVKEAGIVGDAIIASSIVGVLAVLLLAIGCCFLFRHLNLKGSYGIHSNTYEPQSSLHLRDSQYDNDNQQVGAANPGLTATDSTTTQSTAPATTSQQMTVETSSGAVKQTIDTSDGTPC